MTSSILAINSGSSSVKATLFEVSPNGALGDVQHHLSAELYNEHIVVHVPATRWRDARTDTLALTGNDPHEQLFDAVMRSLTEAGIGSIAAIGHRVAHGGIHYRAPIITDDASLADLEKLIPLAPLHQPYCLGGIRALSRRFPGLPQVACFDTAFHVSLPAVETQYALPSSLTELGIRRYGFHGLSYSYIAGCLPEHLGTAAEGRVVVAHLGSGASLCAMHHRHSVATTMGFTALDGLVMGTRSGALDPGIVLYLAEEIGMSHAEITDLLYHRAGLLGVSGESADMRTLLASASPLAAAAIELFCYRVNRELGAMVAALGGLDALVFTGGIGEHCAPVRQRIAELAQWLGIRLDPGQSDIQLGRLSAADSKVSVWVIPTDEERVIAAATLALSGYAPPHSGSPTLSGACQ